MAIMRLLSKFSQSLHAVDNGFIQTDTAPKEAMAKFEKINSGQFSDNKATWSPFFIPLDSNTF